MLHKFFNSIVSIRPRIFVVDNTSPYSFCCFFPCVGNNWLYESGKKYDTIVEFDHRRHYLHPVHDFSDGVRVFSVDPRKELYRLCYCKDIMRRLGNFYTIDFSIPDCGPEHLFVSFRVDFSGRAPRYGFYFTDYKKSGLVFSEKIHYAVRCSNGVLYVMHSESIGGNIRNIIIDFARKRIYEFFVSLRDFFVVVCPIAFVYNPIYDTVYAFFTIKKYPDFAIKSVCFQFDLTNETLRAFKLRSVYVPYACIAVDRGVLFRRNELLCLYDVVKQKVYDTNLLSVSYSLFDRIFNDYDGMRFESIFIPHLLGVKNLFYRIKEGNFIALDIERLRVYFGNHGDDNRSILFLNQLSELLPCHCSDGFTGSIVVGRSKTKPLTRLSYCVKKLEWEDSDELQDYCRRVLPGD